MKRHNSSIWYSFTWDNQFDKYTYICNNTMLKCVTLPFCHFEFYILVLKKRILFFFSIFISLKIIFFTWSMYILAFISVFVGSYSKRLNYFVGTSKCAYLLNKRIILEIKCIFWVLFQFLFSSSSLSSISFMSLFSIFFSTFWNCTELINDKKRLRYIVLHQLQQTLNNKCTRQKKWLCGS